MCDNKNEPLTEYVNCDKCLEGREYILSEPMHEKEAIANCHYCKDGLYN